MMVALLLAAAGSIPFAEQQIVLRRADPCVRLLHRHGEVGCSTGSQPAFAPLHQLSRAEELPALPPAGPLAVALPSTLFDLRTLLSLHSSLGARLAAVLVLDGDAPPSLSPGAPFDSPSADEAPFSERAHEWDAARSGLSRSRFPFGVALLDANESAVVRRVLSRHQPLVQMHYPMLAHRDSPSCLAAESCLPLGGRSVWGAAQPRTAGGAPPFAGRPAVMLAAALDGAAFFHEHAPAADMAVSGTVALLAAIDAVVSNAGARSLLSELPSQLLFAFFTGEAWGGLGSRRFFHDVHSFHCATMAPSDDQSSKGEERAKLPPLPSCASPFKLDLRFQSLRAPIRALVEIGPVGANEARGQLYLHSPLNTTDGSLPAPSTSISDAFGAAAHGTSAPVQAADARLGLPPGPALSSLAQLHAQSAPLPLATAALTDFDAHFVGGARVASRFDTLAALNATLVCEAASLSARAWWRLAGGAPLAAPLHANCTFVDELLGCLLSSTRCSLASQLGVVGALNTHYTGVFLAGDTASAISPTVSFVEKLLSTRILRPACDDVGAQPCEPTVVLHDSYSTELELDEGSGQWRVLDLNGSLWTESNWPAEMFTLLLPYGTSSVAEGIGMLVFGIFNAVLTGVVVLLSRRYDVAYKRL
ncbi:hypothetical protein AB1Y20_017963 [Prymnesium parvum]|uniref:Nicastrin n=1 Tax=Prymnesium parvum TaxID=97485 RepID=A0AB34JPW6_PRYPA